MKQSKAAMMAVALALAALLLSAGGCAVDGEVKEYRDPATLIEVEKGGEFAIVLESNPSTGYQWRLNKALEDKIVTLEKTEFEPPEEELLGAPGEEKWTFKAQGLGRTAIELVYARPWEEGTRAGEGDVKEAAQEMTPKEGEHGAATAGEGEESAEPEGSVIMPAPEGEGPAVVTFSVWVKAKGSMDKEPKKYDNPDEAVHVEEGLEFAIVLESNPTTGYSWRLAEPLEEELVKLVSAEFEKKAGGSHGSGDSHGEGEESVGAPGEEIWTFEALHPGETEIKLEYVRSWETGKAPEKTETFKVEITAPAEGTDKAH